jgi:predicted RNase H-like HicB family nuclease
MRSIHYLVRINRNPKSEWGVSVPDLPGCVATARTLDTALRRTREAIEFHLKGLLEDGVNPPRLRHRSVVPRATADEISFYANVRVSARVA